MSFGSSIQAVFGADTAPLAKGATDAEDIVARFGANATSALTAFGVTLGAGAILGFFKTVIEKGSALQDLSDRLGVGTDELQAWDFAVRQAGGSSEQANMTWDKSRKALDSLAAGQDTATKQFAALGLKAADFVGLDLPSALSKIAAAYTENANTAGAYDAVTDILGSKTAPALNAILLKLGAEGFPAFTAAAKKAGQVMDAAAIARMDEFGDRADALKGRLMSWGSSVFNVFGRATDGLGIMAAAAVNAFNGIETSVTRADFISEKAADTIVKKLNPALVQTTEALAEQKKLKELTAKYDDMIAKAVIDELQPRAKLLEIQRQMEVYARQAVAAGTDQVASQEAMNKGAELALQYRKLAKAEHDKLTAAMRLEKDTELEYAALVVKAERGLTYQESLRLDVLRLQQAELARQYEVKTILAKGVENLTAADKTRLAELFKQKEVIDEQIGQKNLLIAAATTQAVAEKKVTAEMEKQKSFSISTTSFNNKDLTDRQLAEKIANLRKFIDDTQVNDPFGKYSYMTAQQRGDLSDAQKESGRRDSFRRDYSREGEKAFSHYSAFDEQTLRNYIRPEDERRAVQQATDINNIALTLKKITG